MKNVWYKVHKNTKVHEILCDEAVASINKGFCVSLFGYDLIKADADGWIEWNKNSECPLPNGQDYEAEYESAGRFRLSNPEGNLAWDNGGLPRFYTILKYRPILNAEETEMKQEWSGEGLPPIGVDVDARMKSPLTGRMSDWKPVTLAFVHKGEAAMICNDELRMGRLKDVEFRPLPTDRDRWIEAAMAAASCPEKAPLVRNYFESIYDAGLAKLPEQTK